MPNNRNTRASTRQRIDPKPASSLSTTGPAAPRQQSALVKKIQPRLPFIVVVLLLIYIGINAWIYFYGTSILTFSPFLKQSVETVSVVKQQGFGTLTGPKTTTGKGTVSPLPAGKQGWAFTLAPGFTGPKAQTAVVDPLTPKKGDTQTVTITAKHDSPISATATLYTDNKHKSADMKRATGTDTDGTWTVTWTMDDSYDYVYHINFVLTSAKGSWKGGLTFR